MTVSTAPTGAFAAYIRDLRRPGWPILLLSIAYPTLLAMFGELRGEHVIVSTIIVVGWLASSMTRQLIGEIIPAYFIVIAYDSLRYLRPLFVTPRRVLGCELRSFELSLFGVGPDMTIPDYLSTRHTPFLDLFFAPPYAAFAYVAIIYVIVLYFRDRARMRVFTWSFVGMYVIAFALWIAIPAAPPWYIQTHGCAIDMTTASSAAGLLRVDQALGIHYFESFYSRAPTPFGAMPSLHNAYPMMGLLVIWPIAGWKERLANVVYAVWMIVASLYLDHHWLVDGLAGWLTAATAVTVGTLALRARARNAATMEPNVAGP
jgi:membrane-associated phospholipid phosphatase